MKLTSHPCLVPWSRIVNPYIQSLICLHGIVLNSVSTGTTLLPLLYSGATLRKGCLCLSYGHRGHAVVSFYVGLTCFKCKWILKDLSNKLARVRFPVWQDFSVLHNIQTSPPSLLFNGYEGDFHGGKAAGAWSWILPRFRMVESYLHSPICLHDIVLN
jgi:hypothetical protein